MRRLPTRVVYELTHIPTLVLTDLASLKAVIALGLDKNHYVLPTLMEDIQPMPRDDVPVKAIDVVVDQDTQAHPWNHSSGSGGHSGWSGGDPAA